MKGLAHVLQYIALLPTLAALPVLLVPPSPWRWAPHVAGALMAAAFSMLMASDFLAGRALDGLFIAAVGLMLAFAFFLRVKKARRDRLAKQAPGDRC